MERKDGAKVTKTTVKVWQPLVAKLEARMTEACLRRDLYLARLLASEVKQQGTACLLVTHSTAAAARADRVLRLTPKGVQPAAA